MDEQVFKNLNCINSAPPWDLLIVSTSSPRQQAFWAKRLEKISPVTLVIYEDWKGGAGNGLGTLYSFQKARLLGQKEKKIDIIEEIKKGKSAALFHTAGKGTRLAPLPGSEWNNKAAVKVPAICKAMESQEIATILESVIRQSQPYASSRKGRLSVFWGDQIFIPATAMHYHPNAHVDIFAKVRSWPCKSEWEKKGFDRYGTLAISPKGTALFEKLSFDTARRAREMEGLAKQSQMGLSLGSFSLSWQLLSHLSASCEKELSSRSGLLDTDPHFWMPLTLSEETYRSLMGDKDWKPHWDRMNHIKSLLQGPIFQALDVGKECLWWDFGNIGDYWKNLLELTGRGSRAQALRHFFGLQDIPPAAVPRDLKLRGAYVVNSHIKSGNVRNSVLVGVEAEHLDVENSVLINVKARDVIARSSLLYNVEEREKVDFEPGCIRADVFADKQYKFYTHVNRDGKRDWETKLPSNPLSYADLYALNAKAITDA